MKHSIFLSAGLLVACLSFIACGDGHTGDEEQGHYSTYKLANDSAGHKMVDSASAAPIQTTSDPGISSQDTFR